jgi:hypothetical protein
MVRNLILSLLALVLVSCSSCGTYANGMFGGRPLSNSEAATSVYRITIVQRIDVSSIDPMIKDFLGISGDILDQKAFGTAWIAGHTRTGAGSYVMTAGHLCDDSDVFDTKVPEIGKLPILSTKYVLESADGTRFEGATVVLDDDDRDLCLLTVAGDLGPSLPLASDDPAYGAHVVYIGAPKGHWGGYITPILEGLFSGRGYPYGRKPGEYERLVFTASAQHGASGAPVIYRGQVVGLLVSIFEDFPSEPAAVPYDQIKRFIENAIALED